MAWIQIQVVSTTYEFCDPEISSTLCLDYLIWKNGNNNNVPERLL